MNALNQLHKHPFIPIFPGYYGRWQSAGNHFQYILIQYNHELYLQSAGHSRDLHANWLSISPLDFTLGIVMIQSNDFVLLFSPRALIY